MPSGIIVPLMEQEHIDFSYLAANTSEVLTLHTALPIAPYKSGLFMVRIHELTVTGTGKFTFYGYPTLPCSTDGRQFTNTGLAPFAVTVDSSSPAAPAYLHYAASAIGASELLVQIHVSQDTSAQGTLSAQLSAALLLRDT